MQTLDFLNRLTAYQKESKHIEGWLEPIEAFILYSMSYENKERAGRVLEIGSFVGKSTFWLAKGAKDSNGQRIICVDTFKGSIEHQEMLKGGSTFDVFKENLSKADLFEWVTPHRMSSEEAFKSIEVDLSLLFIDASHEYEDVMKDLLTWEQHLIKGGIVMLHDSCGQWEGPTKVADEFIIGRNNMYADVLRVESLTIARRIT